MSYHKVFEKYWNRCEKPVGTYEEYKRVAYNAWKAGRKFQQGKPQPIKWGYHYGY